MGVFLYNVSTDDLEDDACDLPEASASSEETEDCASMDDSWSDGPDLPRAITSTPRAPADYILLPDDSPTRGRPLGRYFDPDRNHQRAARARPGTRRIAYSSEEDEEIPVETSKKNVKWRERPPCTFKYVDDNLQVNRVNMETAVRGEVGGKAVRTKHRVACQNTFRHVIRRAEERGMKVNSCKTAMVCMSCAQSYGARLFIMTADGEEVSSGDSMK